MECDSSPVLLRSRPVQKSGAAMIRAEINVRSKEDADDNFLDNLDGHSLVLRLVRRGAIHRLRWLLLLRHAWLETPGHMGRRPLHIATDTGDLLMMKFLLQRGASVDGRRERGDTPLFWAGTAESAAMLLDHGASIHALDFANREPIHWAAQFRRADVIATLLARGSDPNVRDASLDTPLHWATTEITSPKALDCVRVLIKHGADVNARNKAGRVTLHNLTNFPNLEQRLFNGRLKYEPAVPAAMIEMVKLLIASGADPQLADNQGVSPLDRVARGNAAELISAMRGGA
jgi:ankyrin repeat protein